MTPSGKVDLATAGQFESAIILLLNEDRHRLVVDLSNVRSWTWPAREHSFAAAITQNKSASGLAQSLGIKKHTEYFSSAVYSSNSSLLPLIDPFPSLPVDTSLRGHLGATLPQNVSLTANERG